jgi:hypothetical protein
MSESNIKIFLKELTYAASIPINTYSYYNNLSEELEKEKYLNLSLKIEIEQKEDIIIYLKEKLEKEKSFNQDLNKCSICYENKLSICLNPCGHCYCDICIKNTDNCFICRKNIINKIKLFL